MKYVFVVFLLWICTPVQSQSYFAGTVKEYYRVDPFLGTFSAFVDALSSDSALINKEVYKQTDSTGYYLRGQYKVFNPFSVNAKTVDMLFYENSAKIGDEVVFNFYNYQITAYFEDTEFNRKRIKRDYSKLVRKLKRDWYYSQGRTLKGYQNIEDGEIVSFSDSNNIQIQPATVSWQTLAKNKQLGLTLLIKLRQANNFAYPAP